MDKVISRTVKLIVENSGAQRGVLFMVEEETGQLHISAEYTNSMKPTEAGNGGVLDQYNVTLFTSASIKPTVVEWNGPQSVVNYVRRTSDSITLAIAHGDMQFGSDTYIVQVCFLPISLIVLLHLFIIV